MPLTISRFSASSAVRIVAVAVVSACWRVASSASACTTSIGAIVPTSTRILLSDKQLRRERQRLPGDIDRLNREHVIPVRRTDSRQRVGRPRLQIQLGVVAVDDRRLHLLPGLIDAEPTQQWLGVVEQIACC